MEFSPEEINKKLRDLYGMFDQNNPNWLVSWSEQFEKRYGTFNDFSGEVFVRRVTEIREVRKYPHIRNRWVLERFTPILTEEAQKELVGKKFDSYAVWTFEDKNGKELVPKFIACKYIIETIHKNASERVGVKYKDPKLDKEMNLEDKEKEVKEILEALYGNESDLGDSLAQKSAVGFTKTTENKNEYTIH